MSCDDELKQLGKLRNDRSNDPIHPKQLTLDVQSLIRPGSPQVVLEFESDSS